MRVFMAGAISTGPSKARCTEPSSPSPRPAAILAIVLADAGATSMRSARRASSRWPYPGRSSAPNRSMPTGRPESAAKVAGPTKRRAARVMTTVTPWPRRWRMRMTSTAL